MSSEISELCLLAGIEGVNESYDPHDARNPYLKIYVSTYGLYANGILEGKWLSLPMEDEELERELAKIASNDENPKYPEFMIQDFKTNIPGMNVDESANIREMNELMWKIDDLSLDIETSDKLEALLDSGLKIEYAIDKLDDCIFYPANDETELAELYIQDVGSFSDAGINPMEYLDYDQIGRDVRINGTFDEIDEDGNSIEPDWVSEMDDEELGEYYVENAGLSSEDAEMYFDYEKYGYELVNNTPYLFKTSNGYVWIG